MAIVVSDTSPVRALHHLGLLGLLEQLYGRVYLPDAVADELRRAGRRFKPIEPADHPFFVIESPKDDARVRSLEQRLDRAEAAAIVLAIEHAAEYVLIDERAGRKVAQELGLTVVGVLGILSEGKRRLLVSEIRPALERLRRELDFHLTPALIAEVLRQANE